MRKKDAEKAAKLGDVAPGKTADGGEEATGWVRGTAKPSPEKPKVDGFRDRPPRNQDDGFAIKRSDRPRAAEPEEKKEKTEDTGFARGGPSSAKKEGPPRFNRGGVSKADEGPPKFNRGGVSKADNTSGGGESGGFGGFRTNTKRK